MTQHAAQLETKMVQVPGATLYVEVRGAGPVLALFGGLLIISAVPELSLWLPNTVYAWLGLR